MHFKRVWVAAFLITLIYWCSYQGTEGATYSKLVPFYWKQAINFTLLLVVFRLGIYGFAKSKVWLLQVWITVYALVILIISLLGAADLIIHFKNDSFRNLFGYLRLFFTSPVPYGVILFLNDHEKKLQAVQKNVKTS